MPGHGLGESPERERLKMQKTGQKTDGISVPRGDRKGWIQKYFDRGISFGPRNRTVYLTGEVGR